MEGSRLRPISLFRDADFLEAMKENEQRITGYHDGAGRDENSQSEVVLEINAVSPEDIYSLGGHSSCDLSVGCSSGTDPEDWRCDPNQPSRSPG